MTHAVGYRFRLYDPKGITTNQVSSESISHLISQFAATDWKHQMRFIHLECDHGPTLNETSWTPEFVGYLNLFGHPRGVFVEVLESRGSGNRDAPIPYCPMREGPRERMSRIWVGLRYCRVPTECLVEPEVALSIVRHFLEYPGQRAPGISWHCEEEPGWSFYLSPEDDWFDPDEPETRPTSQTVIGDGALRQRLRASYRKFDLQEQNCRFLTECD